jgi:hypothetical protein
VKTKDIFAGCYVTIAPHEDVWLVSLNTDDHHMVTMRTYQELADAIEAVHEWTLMLSDETEIRIDVESRRQAAQILREALARNALGEELIEPKLVDEVIKRDELRAWFEREMRKD